MRRLVLSLALLGLALACAIPIPTTQPLTIIDPVSVEEVVGAEGAQRATVRLRLVSGDVGLAPAADVGLLRARFLYNVAEWEPKVSQDTEGDGTRVTISQGIGSQIPLGRLDEYVNVWDVGLRPGIPLDLGLDLGAGNVNMELGGLAVSNLGLTTGSSGLVLNFNQPNPEPLGQLRITSGAGDVVAGGLGNANFDRFSFIGGAGPVDLDFAGAWTRSALANVRAGAGDVTIRVPANLGVRVEFSGTPVSSVNLTGFTEREENVYVNAAYGQAALTLTVNVTAGLGSVTLISL